MPVRIVTDSTCDLPLSVQQEFGISVIPCYVNMDSRSYLDGVDISRDDFYSRLPHANPHPTTSAPGHGAFNAEYQRLQKNGADGIVSIHVAGTLSSVVDAARIAAADEQPFPVTVVDSGQLSLGLGLIVIEAARAARDGASAAEITHLVEQLGNRTYIFARLATVEYLRRSGRLSHLPYRLATLLNIKPVMVVHRGYPHMEKVRTLKNADDRLIEHVRDMGDIERIGFLHSNAKAGLEDFIPRVRPYLSHEMPSLIADITPAIGVHVGPGAMGVVCIGSKPLDVSGSSPLASVTRQAQALAR